MAVKLSRNDVEAIARTVASEVGGNVSGDKTEHIKAVVGALVNRADLGYRGNSIQSVVNKPSQFSKISQVGGWEKWTPRDSKMTPAQYAAVRERVVSALGDAVTTGKVSPFTDFANYDASDAVNQKGWLSGFMADPRTVTIGERRTGRSQSYGVADGAPSPNPSVNFTMERNALYPGMAADTIDRNLAADQQAMGPQYTPPSDPGFFSFGGFMPQKPADMTLQDPAPKAYDPLSSISPPSVDMARSLMSGLTPPAAVPERAPVQAGMSGGFGLGVGAAGAAQPQLPLHMVNPAAPPNWPAQNPTQDPMSSLWNQQTWPEARPLQAPWSVEGVQQPPAVTRAPAAQPPTMQGSAGYGLGLGGKAGFGKNISDPFSNPKPLQNFVGAGYTTPGWTVHDTPPGPRPFSPPGRQPAMGAFTQASTGAPQAPQAGGWVARGLPSFNQPSPAAPHSTATANLQGRVGVSPGASAAGSLSFARPPQLTRSIPAVPSTPKPESAMSPAALPSWASLATAAATSAVPGLGMLAAMPATAALAKRAMAAFPQAPQAPAVAAPAPAVPQVPRPVVAPRPKPLAMPAPIAPRPMRAPTADPSLSGWGTMAAANNPFTAAGLTPMGQSALGKNLYGGGYINGVQQVFSGNKPSNAFGGLGFANPFANMFGNVVQRAQAVPSQLGGFLGGFFGGGPGTPTGGSGGGFGGGFGGGTFGGGGWGGGPGSPGHRDSSH